jgi:hypothetical protein
LKFIWHLWERHLHDIIRLSMLAEHERFQSTYAKAGLVVKRDCSMILHPNSEPEQIRPANAAFLKDWIH